MSKILENLFLTGKPSNTDPFIDGLTKVLTLVQSCVDLILFNAMASMSSNLITLLSTSMATTIYMHLDVCQSAICVIKIVIRRSIALNKDPLFLSTAQLDETALLLQ